MMAKKSKFISNLSNLHRRRCLKDLFSSGTCFQIISNADEDYQFLHKSQLIKTREFL